MTPEMEALRDTYIDATEARAAALAAYSTGVRRTRNEMDELQTALLEAESVETVARVAFTTAQEAKAEVSA